MFSDTTPRRGFLARVTAAAAALGGIGGAARLEAQGQASDHDKWLAPLKGKYRQLFDFNAHGDGIGLIHMHNFVETYKSAYGAAPADINVVGTFYGATTPLAWNDAMWAKYKIGAALGLNEPATKAPLERNWFNQPKSGDPVFFNGLLADANIASLQRRGATFIMCRNAFNLWTMRLAQGGDPEPIRKDILANLLPGIVVVPAMVIAVQKAQAAGLTYMRT
jgi:intracellular sulfur oxidation DsrE/DsrF family protein